MQSPDQTRMKLSCHVTLVSCSKCFPYHGFLKLKRSRKVSVKPIFLNLEFEIFAVAMRDWQLSSTV
jgi:hypothetical protein